MFSSRPRSFIIRTGLYGMTLYWKKVGLGWTWTWSWERESPLKFNFVQNPRILACLQSSSKFLSSTELRWYRAEFLYAKIRVKGWKSKLKSKINAWWGSSINPNSFQPCINVSHKPNFALSSVMLVTCHWQTHYTDWLIPCRHLCLDKNEQYEGVVHILYGPYTPF